MKLHYLGGGWLPGYPARDIDEKELDAYTEEQLKELLSCSLYVAEEGYDDFCLDDKGIEEDEEE